MAEKTAKTNPFEQWMDQATAMQTKWIEDTSALAKSSLQTMTDLHAEWTRKALELFPR